jgi:hypothetical protein
LVLLFGLLGASPPRPAPRQTGLLIHEPAAWAGYTLVAPISLPTAYLIDMEGNVVHTWESDAPTGNAVYLLENGNLLRTEQVVPEGERKFNQGGAGGRIREIAPDGTVIWEFTLSTSARRLHHDIERLPNGNVLAICWEAKTAEEALAAGRDPTKLQSGELWPDSILEIRPTPPVGGEIVWEWHVWDHLIQDRDPSLANYGDPAEHRERIDLNYCVRNGPKDWNHTNSVSYNEALDQIMVSVHEFNEIWIIDHSTTTREAASSSGGRYGRGGDLLYRWGNPLAYGAGTPQNQALWGQHDAQWIEGPSGQLRALVFNNGFQRPGPQFSTVDEFVLPILPDGEYERPGIGEPFAPERLAWQYRGEGFYSPNISGVQRLPNGNTLVCQGADGRIFEVTRESVIVWEYVNPHSASSPKGEHAEVFKVRRYALDDPRLAFLNSS